MERDINQLKTVKTTAVDALQEQNIALKDKLDVAVLGILEADSKGNINVSKRGERIIDHVGPGGLPNLTHSAKNIIFVGSWMAGAKFAVKKGKVRIVKPGTHKFKSEVSQVTFNGKNALAMGKKIFYVTNVGAFRLTERGMELIKIMPGIDLEKEFVQIACKRLAQNGKGAGKKSRVG